MITRTCYKLTSYWRISADFESAFVSRLTVVELVLECYLESEFYEVILGVSTIVFISCSIIRAINEYVKVTK